MLLFREERPPCDSQGLVETTGAVRHRVLSMDVDVLEESSGFQVFVFTAGAQMVASDTQEPFTWLTALSDPYTVPMKRSQQMGVCRTCYSLVSHARSQS